MNKPHSGASAAKGQGPKRRSARRAAGNRPPKPDGLAEEGQIGALMSKGLDLAEASLTLGLNLVQRLGTTMQDQVIGKIAQAGQAFMQAATPPAAARSPEAPSPGPSPAAPGPGPGFAGVTNRQPLFPGSPLRVSFSINNESPGTAKKVAVRLGPLTGEISHATLDGSTLAIEPATATIAPSDFEKFVITGVVPPGVASDAYQGWIEVAGEERLRIPLRLTITSGTRP